ncbi:ABC transporter permease [Actinoplanes sp. NPDC051861]|uniref:ABC transporter permease n=1 Tax=Actinoplanes sp. NPDC051861 TaxID=3155170 RepID=UPI0034469216
MTGGRRLRAARLSPIDLARLGVAGLRARPLRVFLATLGIAIGIAAMLAVVGVTTSSQAHLDRELKRLGTNLLTVEADDEHGGLPAESTRMVARIAPVESVGATGRTGAAAYRNDHVPAPETSSVEVLAAEPALAATLDVTVAAGNWFSPATTTYPAVVLGATAARRLDVPKVGLRLWMAGEWFVVIGILEPATLVPELDAAVLVGWGAARTYLNFNGRPTTMYVRASEHQVAAVRDVLGRTANPESPQHVLVSRPSDALAAKQATDATLSGTLLGLGAVALLVGGIGIANTMVISVLERRAEIGLRRALGATRGHIRMQFLIESLLLAGTGGATGVVLGVVAAGVYAYSRQWPAFVPTWATAGSMVAALLIGAIAGLYPAVRASRLAPTAALAG